MSHYAWITDIHLDHVKNVDQTVIFFQQLIKTNPEGIIISGDISTAPNIVMHLGLIESIVQRPVYFVLGNHDYYGGSIDQVRKQMAELEKISPFLKYLPNTTYHMLNSSTAIIGHDTWYDVINGAGPNSKFKKDKFDLIYEFKNKSQDKIIELARQLSHEGVVHLQKGVKEAFRYAKKIIVVSHVPPYAAAHVHNGRQGSADEVAWFTSKLLGDMLTQASIAFPDRHIISLSGHTHGQFENKMARNLEVLVGGAEYGTPTLAKLISI